MPIKLIASGVGAFRRLDNASLINSVNIAWLEEDKHVLVVHLAGRAGDKSHQITIGPDTTEVLEELLHRIGVELSVNSVELLDLEQELSKIRAGFDERDNPIDWDSIPPAVFPDDDQPPY